MNVLITGANGQLGSELRKLAANGVHHYIYTDIQELDICNDMAVRKMVQQNEVDAIINCSAYTNVDKAEDEEALAERLNNVGVQHLASAMRERGGWLVHVSTDYVFGGNQYNVPIAETMPVNPTGAYGRTKLHGEQSILQSGCRYIILRTAWLYSSFGRNFVKTMLSLIKEKPQLQVVFDQVGTPTYAGDLAAFIYYVIEHRLMEGRGGIYHFSNEGVCSWYDFAKEIARQSDYTQCNIQPCHSNEFQSKVTRPSYSVLDKSKVKENFSVNIPHWTESLSRCLVALGEYRGMPLPPEAPLYTAE